MPDWETSLVGPFDRWADALGFDYFYGFVGGDTDQYTPALVEGKKRIEAPKTNEDGSPYHLTTDLADHAIRTIRAAKAVAPQRPFFVYFATGATHAPHQVPQEWIDKFKGQFDMGWDKYREETFERQKAMGVIPQNAKLTPRPDSLPALPISRWPAPRSRSLPMKSRSAAAASRRASPTGSRSTRRSTSASTPGRRSSMITIPPSSSPAL